MPDFLTRAALSARLGLSVDTLERLGKRYAFFRRAPGGFHKRQVAVITAYLAGGLTVEEAERLWRAERTLLVEECA